MPGTSSSPCCSSSSPPPPPHNHNHHNNNNDTVIINDNNHHQPFCQCPPLPKPSFTRFVFVKFLQPKHRAKFSTSEVNNADGLPTSGVLEEAWSSDTFAFGVLLGFFPLFLEQKGFEPTAHWFEYVRIPWWFVVL